MPRYYPVFLDLQGKQAVVIGGGEIAERKIHGLVPCGARITLVSPELTPELERLAAEGTVTVHRRTYQPGDMKGAAIAVVGTDDPEVNHQAAEEARREGVLVNTVDDVAYCDYIAPALVQRGDLTVAISTHGKSPAMARRMREELERLITNEYADLLQVLENVRARLRRERVYPSPDCWQEHIDDGLRAMVRRGELEQAQERLARDLTRATARG